MKKSIVASVLTSFVLICTAIAFPQYPSPSSAIGSIVGFFFPRESTGEQYTVAGAVPLIAWNTSGNTGLETTEPPSATDPNIAVANLTQGAGVTPAANANRFGGNAWFDAGDTNPTTLAQSVAGNDYIQFVVVPNAGFMFTPTSLDFIWDRSNTGPSAVTLRSSLDGFTGDLGSVIGLPASISAINTINISGLSNITAATTFRLYGYGGSNAGGTGGFDTTTGTTNNVVLNGTVSAVSPEMNVTGNSVIIADGDTDPSLADHTAFGPTAVTGGSVVRTFTIENTGTGALSLTGSPKVAVSGTNPADFAVNIQPTSPVAPTGNTTFQVTFNPSGGGVRTATLSIANDDADENPYDFSIRGSGTFTLSFNGNNNTGGTAPGPVSFESLAGVLGPGSLVRTGFHFTGWNTAANGSGTEYFPGQSFIIGVDTTLYAQWAVEDCNPGGPDASFDGDGKAITDVGGANEVGRGVAIQADGKIVVVGAAFGLTSYDFAVVRYNTNGSLDTGFDGDGKVITDVLGTTEKANAVALQPDGKIIVAGYGLNGGSDDFVVVRYNPNGSLDTSFDADGKVTYNGVFGLGDIAYAVALQPDGKIVVAGSSNNGSDEDYAIIRLNDDGSLDTTFNVIGATTFPILGSDDVANSIALQTDGKVVVGGYTDNGHDFDFALARLSTTGALDPTFGNNGRANTGVRVGDDLAFAVAIQADGKIILAGHSRGTGPDTDFAAVRYETDGDLDNSFDADGRVTTQARGPDDQARAVAIQPDGRIVLAGFSDDGSNSDFAAVRLLIDGSLDTTFDLDGKVTTDIQGADDEAWGVAIQNDGKIIVAGNGIAGGLSDFAVVRYGSECFPEMEVTGNGVPIVNADSSPALADHTDFSLASTVGGSVVRTFTIRNSGTANLVVSNPTISGTNAAEFTITQNPTSPVTTPFGTTTFKVTFVPTAVGLRTATVNIVNDDADENPYTFAIQGTGIAPFSGSISVGTGETYPSLTNAGGLFEALNAGGLSGDLTISLASDLTTETGDFSLRHQSESGAGAGTYRVLIKPSAAPRIVSGSNSNSLIRLDGADRVTIDGWSGATIGSAPGGSATRDLTITNTTVIGSPSIVSIINTNANPAQNNKIQNAIVVGTAGTYAGVVIGGIVADPPPGPDNDNNSILNCLIKNVDYGIYTLGESPANPNLGTRLEENVINATGSDHIRLVGIAVQNESGIQIIRNDIGNIDRGEEPGTVAGIAVGLTDLHTNLNASGGVIDAFVSSNKIDGAVSSAGYTAVGIAVAGASGTSNTIVNNMITGVKSTATAPDIVAGILVSATSGSSTRIYHNSVAMTGDRGNANIPSSPSFALAITGIAPVEVKNNIFYTTQTAIFGTANAKSFAVGLSASTFFNLDLNFNGYLSTGLNDSGFRTGGFFTEFTDHADLAAWQTATNKDADSQEVNPIFTNPTSDLHLQVTSPVVNNGTPIPTVVVDFDGDARSATTPDIGADEIAGIPEISVEDFNSTVIPDNTGTVDFGSHAILVPGTPQTFTVRNVGTDPLIVSTAISVTGPEASEFVVNNTGMSPMVAPGGSTAFTVTFTPTATGTRTATLSIANNDPDENPFNFTIQGTGVIPAPQTRYVATTGSNGGPNDCLMVGSPCATIEYAISVANPADTVSIAAGTYTEFGLVVNKDLIFTGAGSGSTFVQASGSVLTSTDRVFTINNAVIAAMSGLTIQNGKAPNGATGVDCSATPCGALSNGGIGGSGGGILNNGTLTLTSVALSNNRSGNGGTAGNVTCVTGPCNTLGGKGGLGGAVDTTGPLTVISSTFTNNTTGDGGTAGSSSGCGDCSSAPGEQGNGGAIGGAITSISESIFTGNSAFDGGAVQQGLSAIAIANSAFSGNTATNSGGAINCNGTAVAHTCSITGSTINNSHVSGNPGGAVAFVSSSDKFISNSTVSNNTSNGNAGGILASAGTVTISFVTVAGNTADDDNNSTGNGGGLRNEGAICNLRNSIIADNIDKGGEADQISGTITSLGYNHIESIVGGIFALTTGDVINSGPALAPLANNGGPTQTQGLYSDSPAIDQIPSGTNGCGIAPFDVDQRGVVRPGGIACDKGAFEGDLGVAPQEIDITGLGFSIIDGDVTPSTTDDTDFGSVPPTSGFVDHIFTVHNSGTGTLTISNPTIEGPNQSDFIITVLPSTTVGPGLTTQFTVRFDPSAAGLRSATVSIANNDNNEDPYNFDIQGTGVQTFTGIVNVGDGETYTSLTNVDGIFSAFDTGILSSDVTINITSDLTAETGEFGLRTLTETGVGNYHVLIKPSAAGRIISGSFNGTLVRIDGADRVTIDGWSGATVGSPAGSPASRDLTIINTATSGTPSVLSIINTHTNPSLDNTFQNLNAQGTPATQAGVIIGGATGPDVDNSHILSCSIKSTDFGIYTFGESAANPNTGTRIEHNVLNATGADRVRFIGITVQNETGIQIIGNNIGNIDAVSVAGVVMGIGVGVLQESQFNAGSTISGGVVGALVSGNTIAGAKTNTNFSAGGIVVAGGAGTNTIVNNMISGVRSAATSPDVVAGIFVAGTAGSTTTVYNNSIAMTGDRGNLSLSPSFGVAITGSDPTVELKNNIFYTTQTAIGGGPGALSFAIGTNSSTFANLDSNYNAFYSSGPQDSGFRTGGLIVGFTNYPDLAAWRTAVSDDANSIEVDPSFVDPALDPHLQLGSLVSNAATPLASVTVDIDGQSRSLTAPDIGADEIVGTPDIAVLDHNLTILINGVSTADLGSEIVAVPGAAKTFTVRNVGTDPLSVSTTITVTGTNASEFVVNSTGMSPTVGIGDNTMFTVTFTPAGPGLRTAAVSITSNDPDENPFTFALQGTGVATYTVTYDGNGNTGGAPPVDAGNPHIDGSLVGVLGPGTLVKTGSQFTGWNTAANGSGAQYSPAQAFVINANTTLFAQWTLLQCAPGGLDPAFGIGGKVTTDILGNSDNGRSSAIQADGKIVVAGSANTGTSYDFAVLRYNADGTLDTSFDTDGKATTDIVSSDDFGNAVAIQTDGKIVVAGSAHNGSNYDFAVARYNTDGSLDTSFDTDGKKSFAVVSGDDFANGLVIQPDGKILMVGYGHNGSNYDFTLVRVNSDGTFDATFNADGIVTAGILTNNDFGYGVALQADGKIVVSGYTNAGVNNDFALMRFNTNGSLDTSFGTGGSVSTAFLTGDDESYSVAIQVDGKIVLAGHSVTGSGTDFAVARYNTDGSLDASFDSDGKLTTDILGADDFAESVAIQPDGRVVVGGYTNNGSNTDFAVVRLNADGTFDTSFDADGKAVIAVSGLDDKAYEVAIQRDGEILVVGDSVTSSDRDLAIVRLGGPCSPVMNVTGNDISIVDGDTTPSLTDHTNFGFAMTSETVVRTFTIQNTGSANLDLSIPTITGTNSADFVVTLNPNSTVAPGGSTTFQVTFGPTATGLRTATVNISNNAGAQNPFDFAIAGTGFLGATAPIANDDTGPGLTEDGSNGTVNVLTNDTDPNGNPTAPVNGAGQFTVDVDTVTAGIQTIFSNAQGVWTLDTATGLVTFDPAINFDGTAVISYTLCDPTALCDNATITFVVTAVNDPPVANSIAPPAFNEDTESIITLSYTDAEADLATSCLISGPTNVAVSTPCSCTSGVCSVGVTGAPTNYNGLANFTFTVTANSQTSNSATASLTITPVDDPPVANAITPPAFDEDTQSIITLSYTDIEAQSATACAISSPTNITVSQACSCNGSGVCTVGVTGSPLNYNGPASFAYTVTAGAQISNSASAGLSISPVNDAPTSIAPASASTTEDSVLNFTGANLFSVADVDGTNLTVTAAVTNGTLSMTSLTGLVFTTGDGTADATMTFGGTQANLNTALASLTFSPTPDYYGAATLTFSVTDTVASPVLKTIALTITSVADITDDSVSTNENTPITFNAITGTNGATADTFEGTASVTSVTQGAHGGVTFLANGDLTYTPMTGYFGPDSFTYTVTSGGVTETATVSVNVINAPGTLVVDNTSDDIALNQCVTGTPGDCSLRGANSIAQNGDTIVFDPGVFSLQAGTPQTITLVGTEIAITSSITIAGPGADKLIINGGGGQNRIFLIDGLPLIVTISGVSLTDGNGAGGGINSVGGAIFARCQLTLDGVHIFQNGTVSGGGVGLVDAGPYTIKNSTINNNSAVFNGGGIDKEGTADLTITNSTISENAVTGAAQLSPEGTSGFGGGMSWFGSGNATVRNSTVTGNSAPAGGGIGILGGTLSVGSTIVAGNIAAAQVNGNEINSALPASVVSVGFNLVGDAPGDSGNTGAPISYSSSDILDTDPQLGILANYGGPTPTHNLLVNSPGRDKGCAFGATTDQRGVPRTIDWPTIPNATCTNPSENGTDIGSFELLSPTAAATSIGGQVRTSDGLGITHVIVTVRDRNGSIMGTARTTSFGFYTVDGLSAGQLYIVSVQSNRFVFPVDTVTVWLYDSLKGLDFVATP